MDYIRPQKLSFDFIRNKAEEFRNKYIKPPDRVPVPIEEIVEFQLKINIVPIPHLLTSIDVDGFLSNDLKSIYIDQNIYIDKRFVKRLRFTFAHEIAHLVLHEAEIRQCHFKNEEEWLQFRENMSEDDLVQFEQQAYEFAGRLLVPRNKLLEELEIISDKIDQFKSHYDENQSNSLNDAISRIICDKFGVSDGVILRRLKNERINL